MTREELLELAALDGLGLLDEYEAALYTRSFHHASVAVQDEIRALQAEIAADPALLANVELPVELRERVLRAVARAIESESAQLAPLAMIGRTRAERRESAPRARLGASGQVWRAAALVLAGVLVVSLYFFGQRTERNRQLMDLTVDLLAQEQIADVLARESRDDIAGVDLGQFLNNQKIRKRVILPVMAGTEACAFVYVDEATNQALLLTVGLPTQTRYNVDIRTDDDEIRHRTFKPGGTIGAVQLGTIPLNLVASMTITVSTDAGVVVLRA